jgi:hypothetical protein
MSEHEKTTIIAALTDQCELIQDDLSCILDGIADEDRILTNADQMIVERVKILIRLVQSI